MRKLGARTKLDSAVSPIIAVMLLLMITIVLTAVVYQTFSQIGGPGEEPVYIGISITRPGDGLNWSVTMVSVSREVRTDFVKFVIRNQDWTYLLNYTPISELPGLRDLEPVGFVSVGDYVLLPVSLYPPYSHITILAENHLFYDGELR